MRLTPLVDALLAYPVAWHRKRITLARTLTDTKYLTLMEGHTQESKATVFGAPLALVLYWGLNIVTFGTNKVMNCGPERLDSGAASKPELVGADSIRTRRMCVTYLAEQCAWMAGPTY